MDRAIAVSRAAHLLLAALGMYAWMRILRLGRPSALVGGLVFGFGSFTIGQLHHENVVRTAVWLPLTLLLLELALRSTGWRCHGLLIAAGLSVGVSMLGLHVQLAAMSILVVAAWVVFRTIWPIDRATARNLVSRLMRMSWSLGLPLGVGLGVAAIQLIPLFELGRASFRAGGVSYEFASAFSLVPHNLLSLVFPYFFRLPEGDWWTLWHPWETTLYVGLATLPLIPLGLLAGRREAVFFAVLGTLAFVVAMSHYSPLNLHQTLWQLPGFSYFRAPGRFSYLIVLCLAALAALGAEWLQGTTRSRRTLLALGCGMLAVSLALGAMLVAVRSWVLSEPQAARDLLAAIYLEARHQSERLAIETVLRGAIASLDLANPNTALSLGLLLGTAGVMVGSSLQQSRRLVGWGMAALIALDLGIFAFDYHPLARLAELAKPAPATEWLARNDPQARVLVEQDLADYEPNQLLEAGLVDLGGYVSAPSQRHFELWTQALRQPGQLLDLWAGGYYLSPNQLPDARTVQGRTYYPEHPLLEGPAPGLLSHERFDAHGIWADQVWAIGWLSQATHLSQGTPVAELTIEDSGTNRRTFRLRAGEHLSERAYDRGDVAGNVLHAKAAVVDALVAPGPEGGTFQAYVYLAELGLPQPAQVVSISVRALLPQGELSIFGLGLRDSASGRSHSLAPADRSRFKRVYFNGEVSLYRNEWAYPRAFVVYNVLPHERSGDDGPLSRMLCCPFDPLGQVLLEGHAGTNSSASAEGVSAHTERSLRPRAAEVTDISPDLVLVRATLERDGYLVLSDLYHRGWTALEAGAPTPVYLANSMFRAVALGPGTHEVQFVFHPLSLELGAFVTFGTLLTALAALIIWAARQKQGMRNG